MVANKRLINEMGISSEDEEKINMAHEVRLVCEKDMEYNEVDSYEFQHALTRWRNMQRVLQKLWGFPPNKHKWKEWHLPKCTCPKIDNDDVGNHYYITNTCPIHGDNKIKTKEKLYTKNEVYELIADEYMKYDTVDTLWYALADIFGEDQ